MTYWINVGQLQLISNTRNPGYETVATLKKTNRNKLKIPITTNQTLKNKNEDKIINFKK